MNASISTRERGYVDTFIRVFHVNPARGGIFSGAAVRQTLCSRLPLCALGPISRANDDNQIECWRDALFPALMFTQAK